MPNICQLYEKHLDKYVKGIDSCLKVCPMHFSYVPENKWQIWGALIDLNIFLHFMTFLVLSQENWKYDNTTSK